MSETTNQIPPNQLRSLVPPIVGGVLSIVPGLGQIAAKRVTRGLVLMFMLFVMTGIALWRIDNENIDLEVAFSHEDDTTALVDIAADASASDDNILNTPDEVDLTTDTSDLPVRADILASDDRLTTFLAALELVELPEYTDTERALTLFVPSDQAFNELFATYETAAEYFAAPENLRTLLRYHMVEGRFVTQTYIDFGTGDINTLADEQIIEVDVGLSSFSLNDDIEPVTSDILSQNSVIYVLDTVLLSDELEDGLERSVLKVSVLPPNIEGENLSRPQRRAVTYAFLALSLLFIVYVWNIYDGYRSASNNPAPSQLFGGFLVVATLILGLHITEIDLGKAIREVDDVRPRLVQILWPWDDVWIRDIEQLNGSANWETPCDEIAPPLQEREEGQPYLIVDPTCGEPSGIRRTDGTRDEGTTVTIEAFGFRPNEIAEVWVKPSSIPEFRPRVDGEPLSVITDSNGDATLDFVMPNFTIPDTAVGSIPVIITVRQTAEVGNAKLNEDFWLAFESIIETVFLALMATAGGLILAVPFSFLAARNLMSINPMTTAIYYVVRLVMNVIRSIEPLVWALIATIWVGPGPFAGVLALMIHTIAALGKLYSESIENIDNGPIEAIQATGANRLQTIIYAVVPQVIPPFVSFTIYRWDINVRMSTIIGAVGGGGIGFFLFQWIRIADYDAVGVAVWMIAIVVTLLDYISARIRERYV